MFWLLCSLTPLCFCRPGVFWSAGVFPVALAEVSTCSDFHIDFQTFSFVGLLWFLLIPSSDHRIFLFLCSGCTVA